MKANRCILLLLASSLTLLATGSSQGLAVVAPKSNSTPAPKAPHHQKDAESASQTRKRQNHEDTPAPEPPPTPYPTLKPGEWEAFIDPEQQIFPSLLLASATLNRPLRDDTDDEATPAEPEKPHVASKAGADEPKKTMEIVGDRNGLVGVTLCNPSENARVELKVKANAYMEDSTLVETLPTAGKEYHLLPRINYKFDVLNLVRQSRPVNVVYCLKIDGKEMGERMLTARVRPINDCPFAYQNPDDEKDYMNISWMFAAYVNEDDPAIPALLKEAQDTGVVDGFDAYQSDDPGEVLLQVFAVWSALQKHGIKYSDIGTTATNSDALYTMHVRFIQESLSETHANCVDASVLLASVLRRMGIEPFLVVQPDHMFLGIYLDAEGKDFACLETTMLSDPDPPKYKTNRALARVASRQVKKMKGWGCFNEALDSATREYKQNKKKYGDDSTPQYSIVDIEAARHEGIAPIAYIKGN